jgi:hypothetical protein
LQILGNEFKPVNLWHHVIHDDKVYRIGLRPFQPGAGIREGMAHTVIELFDQCTEQNQVDFGVINDQNMLGHKKRTFVNMFGALIVP